MTGPRLPDPVVVTGATGNVGSAVVTRLLADGYATRALVRSRGRAADLLPPEVELFEGDITDPAAVAAVVHGAGTVIHAAGLPEQWSADPSIFDRVNRGGTVILADAALAAGVATFIYVSTIDVFVWPGPGKPFTEVLDPAPKHTAYEQSKQAADRAVAERVQAGLPARFACPAGVFGPAPTVTPGANTLLRDLLADAIPMLLPGGLPLLFNEDCADGIMRVGLSPVGTRAILSGPYLSLVEIAQLVHEITGTTKVPRVLPRWFAHLVSSIGEARARWTGRPPLIPRGQLHFLEQEVVPDASYARETLGWQPTPLVEAVTRTINWLAHTPSH